MIPWYIQVPRNIVNLKWELIIIFRVTFDVSTTHQWLARRDWSNQFVKITHHKWNSTTVVDSPVTRLNVINQLIPLMSLMIPFYQSIPQMIFLYQWDQATVDSLTKMCPYHLFPVKWETKTVENITHHYQNRLNLNNEGVFNFVK